MAAPRVEVGRIWHGYVVERILAEGSTANVFLVQHAKRKTHHALKVLKNVDPRKRARIAQEAIFREGMFHDNLVPAIECIEVDGQPGLVMDYVEGPNLREWLDQDAPEEVADRLQVFRGIVEGCAHAHARGIIHRALAPSNVLVEKKPDGRFVARVGDFGLARALSPELGKFGGLTTVNTQIGAVGYTAPEQVRDPSKVDLRADLYSLGCLLYELVCGTAPFAGLSMFDAMQAQREGRYVAPEELAPDLPPALHQLIRELLEPDRDRRIATCYDVLQRLDRIAVHRGSVVATHRPVEAGTIEYLPALGLAMIPVAALALGVVVVFLS